MEFDVIWLGFEDFVLTKICILRILCQLVSQITFRCESGQSLCLSVLYSDLLAYLPVLCGQAVVSVFVRI